MLVLTGLVAGALVLTTLWAMRYSRSKKHQWRLAEKIPGPKGWPILGISLSFTGNSEKTFQKILGWVAKFGSTVRVWIGPKLYVFVTDPADLRILLKNPMTRNRDYVTTMVLSKFIGDGILTSRYDKWHHHRKLMAPAFNGKVLESYVQIFAKKASILAEQIRHLADGRTTDIYKKLSLCSLDSLCETATGLNMDVQLNGRSDFGEAISEAFDLVHNRTLHPWLLVDWIYSWTSDGKRAKSIIHRLHEFSEGVIASKLAAYKNKDINQDSSEICGEKKISSFLDLLIESSGSEGQLMTATEMRDEVTTMAAAAMETSSSTMAHALVLLGMHPEYQDKIYEELEAIFHGDTRMETPEDLNRMKVMEYALKETLRLFPPAILLSRDIDQDLEISNGCILPAGCSVLGLNYVPQHNPVYFPDPESFTPERWTPENSVGRHPFAFLPFGAGLRNCIGQRYGMLAMKTTLSCLLRQYRLTCDCYTMKDLARLKLSISVTSVVGYRLQIHKRIQV